MPRIRPWLLVVIILIGVGVYLAITSFGPKPKQPAPHQRERATPASEQAKTQLRAAVLRDAPETVETDLEGLVGIAGTVLSPDGEPLPQAEIWGWYPGCIFYRRKTDEDGRFKFERDVPWGTVPGEYFILAEHPKYAWAARGPFTIEANHALKDFTIRLNEGGFVAGVVRDEDGIPVKNATVWFQTCAQPKGITDEYIVMKLTERKGVSTDERGTYTSIALLPGTYVVGAEHRDLFDAKNQTVEILAGETITGVDLVLGNGVSVSGRVTDLSGIPLPGAKVSVWMENAEIRRRKAEEKEYLPDHDEYIRRETLTDETGSFLLRGLEPGPCHVHAGDADFYSDRRFYIAYKAVTAPAEDIMFQLEPLPCIKGLVIDETNRAPIKEYTVGFRGPFGTDPFADKHVLRRQIKTEDGAFELAVHDYGTYMLFIDGPGYAPATIRSIRVVEGFETEELVVPMTRGETLTFHVSSAKDGSAVENAQIWQKTSREVLKYLYGRTDAQGICIIENCPPGRHTFEVTHDDFSQKLLKVASAEEDVVEVGLDPGIVLRGRLVSKAEHKAIADAVVNLYPLDENSQELGACTDAEGAFAIEHISAGGYLLEASYDDVSCPYSGLSHQEIVLIENGATGELLIELGTTGRVIGTVTMADGKPATNAMVGLGLSGGEGDLYATSVSVHRDGTYVIGGLRPGTHDISACLRMGASYWVHKHVVVQEGRDTRVDFVLGGARLHGRITADGKPAYDLWAAVHPRSTWFWGPGNGTEAFCFTGEQGHYDFEGLIPGEYVLTVGSRDDRDWDAAHAARREVQIGQDDVCLDLAFDGECIAGRVVMPNGEPAKDARILLYSHPGAEAGLPGLVSAYHVTPWQNQDTDAGSFEFQRIMPDSYYLTAEKVGYATAVLKIAKKAGEDLTNLVVRLEPDTVIEAHVSTDDGETPEEIWVTACDEEGRFICTRGASIELETRMYPVFGFGPGRYIMVAEAHGYAPCRAEATVLTGEKNHVHFDFKRGRQVTVTALDASRSPVAGAQVVLDPGDHAVLGAELIKHAGVQGTDSNGHAILRHVADGDCIIHVLAPGYEPSTAKVCIAGSDKEITVTLTPGNVGGE